MSNQVFVTGMGIITGLGIGKEENLQAIFNHKTAIEKIRFLKSKHTELPAAEVKYTNEELCDLLNIDKNEVSTRTSLIGRIALKEALEEAKITYSRHCEERRDEAIQPKHKDCFAVAHNDGISIAFINGTTVGGMDKSEQFYLEFLDENNNSKNKYIESHDCGTTTELIAQQFDGNFDCMTTISTACSSALNAVILGANLIKTGQADIAIVGGTECISKFHFNGFNTLMILDKEQCRPFDKTRTGLNLGEGAAYLVLESEKSVKNRNIKPLCKLLGYSNTCDAFHQTATSPDGIGATLAMKKAIEKSNLTPKDIDYINAHGTGTDNNDLTEGIAIMNVFENDIPNVSSLKSFLGHTTSAAGSVEAVISILAMLNNFIPASLNFNTKIDELSFIPNKENILNAKINTLLTNSFGFGGNDTACVFTK